MVIAGAKRQKQQGELPWIEPVRPLLKSRAFDHPDWIYELKYDGFRGLAYIEAEIPRFMSRNRNKMSRFDALARSIAAELNGTRAIIDGEIVCVDPTGRPIFRDLIQRRGIPVYYAFDLLWVEGEDLGTLPLMARKERLAKLIPRPVACITTVNYLEEHGTALYNEVLRLDLEGIVAKHKDKAYDVDAIWYKIKNKDYRQAEGRQELFTKFRKRRAA